MSSRAVWLVLAALALAVVLMVASPAQPAAASCGGVTTVGTQAELNAAIAAFNGVAAGPCVFTIQLTQDIPLTASTTMIDNATAGTSLVIEGAGHTVDGQGTSGVRGFYVYLNTHVTINQITIKGGNLNESNGAGIRNQGNLTLANSTITGNSVTGTQTVGGGGISNARGATLIVRNSTISGNSSAMTGGGIGSDGAVTLDSVTITNNSSNNCGSGYCGATGSLTIRNSIIAGNTGRPDCEDLLGNITDQGHNLVQSQPSQYDCKIANGVNGNITGLAADLGPLANNGGPTWTHLPNAGSPAINAGDTDLTTDQRGITRPQGAADDIGAVEAVICPASPWDVATEAELNFAIGCYNAQTAAGVYTINVTQNINLTASATAINNANAGLELQILGAFHTVDGQGTAGVRPFEIAAGAVVNIGNITITGGNVPSGDGGGIRNAGALTLYNSSITANASRNGGGIDNVGILTIEDSTIANNQQVSGAVGQAAGIYSAGTLTIRNSTVSGNQAVGSAIGPGGIQIFTGSATFDSVTVANNVTNNASGLTGGVSVGPGSTVTMVNTVVSDNSGPGADDNIRCSPVANSVAITYSLLQSANAECNVTNGVAGNIVGVSANLGPLANNGGSTQTHLPNAGSPVINAGDTTLTVDQRGVARPFGTADDIGAVEVDTCPSSPWNVDTEAALNQAIACFNAATAPGVYTINVTQNINLTASTTAINNANAGLELQILGGGKTVDGQAMAGVRPFEIAASTTVKISSLTVTGGNVTGSEQGGGILNNGNLSLTGCTISGNQAGGTGGGIRSDGGALTVTECTISANRTDAEGGGISNGNLSVMQLTNSTVSGNISAFQGGGVYNVNASGSATIDSSTIANNTAGTQGGGVVSAIFGKLALRNTLVGDNSTPDCYDALGTFIDNGHNLFESASPGCTSQFPASNGNIIGVDPNLGPLAFNGGPTETRAPQPGSPAINAGDTTLAFDQRGVARPQGGADDIGAVEVACAAFPVSVANEGQLNFAIGCYNAITTAGVYTINVTQDILLTASTTVINNTTTGVSLVIEGAGFEVNGGGVTPGLRPFEIASRTTVTMNDLTVTGGNMPSPEDGGGIRNSGILTLNDATVTGNFAGFGGGIYSVGANAQLTLNNTTVAFNRTSGDGGGINSNAALTVNDSTIQNNEADSDGGGVFIFGRTATISNTLVKGNLAGSNGGGVYNRNGTVTITGSALSNNTAVDFGGGVRNQRGAVTIVDSTLSGNAVRDGGGGIDVTSGTLTVTGSTVANNEAENNAGTKGSGGGLQISIPAANRPPAFVSFKNSTFSGNSAGGNAADDGGGAMMVYAGTLTLDSVTVAGNSSAAKGGGIAQVGGTVSIRNTIVGDNSAAVSGPDLSGAITSADYNLVENTAGRAFTPQPNDIVGVDPALGPLAFNGGTTQTRALLPGSPAINKGNTTLTTDQRGLPRPAGAADDIGAYEEQNPLAITLASFEAQAQAGHVLVSWVTVSEAGNAGFNLYRTSSDQAPTPADLLTYVPSQGPGSAQGFAYAYQDQAVTPGETTWYWLEDVSLGGVATLHGPVSVVYVAPTAVTLSGLAAAADRPAAVWPWLLLAAVSALAAAGALRTRRSSL